MKEQGEEMAKKLKNRYRETKRLREQEECVTDQGREIWLEGSHFW